MFDFIVDYEYDSSINRIWIYVNDRVIFLISLGFLVYVSICITHIMTRS